MEEAALASFRMLVESVPKSSRLNISEERREERVDSVRTRLLLWAWRKINRWNFVKEKSTA